MRKRSLIKYNGRDIVVNYMGLSPKEVRIQHALGTLTWSVQYYRSYTWRHRHGGRTIITAPDALTAARKVEEANADKNLYVYIYQVNAEPIK